MIKLLKWDFLNFFKSYYRQYMSFAAVLIMTVLMPDNIPFLSAIIDGISTVYSILFFFCTVIISATEVISWLRKGSTQLELSIPVKPWKVLLSKLILVICANATGVILTLLLWSQIGRFGMANIRVFNGFISFIQYLMCMLILHIIIMFSYILAKSFRFTRDKAGNVTVLLSVSIYMLLILIVSIIFITTGAWDITIAKIGEYQGGFSISANEKLSWMAAVYFTVASVVIILAGFFSSSMLFKHRFERY